MALASAAEILADHPCAAVGALPEADVEAGRDGAVVSRPAGFDLRAVGRALEDGVGYCFGQSGNLIW